MEIIIGIFQKEDTQLTYSELLKFEQESVQIKPIIAANHD